MMNGQQKRTLTKLISHPVQWDCLLSKYTSFSIGGAADAVVIVDKKQELPFLLQFFIDEKVQWRIIGKGTNLLVKDSGYAGVIVILGDEFSRISKDYSKKPADIMLTVGAACSLGRLSNKCTEKGFSGLEFATGIPGTVGGSVVMNAGAWGYDMASVINSLKLTNHAGDQTIKRKDLDFGYRYWHDFKEFAGKCVVTEVEFRLCHLEPEKIKAHCRVLRGKRGENQPQKHATAGSFFKNPANDSAGRLIEASGFKGVRVGGAMVSEKHANFLVNQGGATAADVLALMCSIQEKVKRDSGVDLEPEVHFI